jgi:hypothetical protein
MTFTLVAPHHCPSCEHSNDLCAALVMSIRREAAQAMEMAARMHVTLAPLAITIDCPCYWKRGRSHGP